MTELNLELDNVAIKTINRLMNHYKTNSRAEIIKKAVSLLTVAAYIDKTDGQLIARKEGRESTIIV
jgi:hypothetical protein